MYLLVALAFLISIGCATNASLSITSGSAPPQRPSPGCTTLQPLFGFPSDGTSTVFPTIVTATSTVDCNGCTPTIKIFNYSITEPPPTPTTTITNTKPLTFFEIECLPTQESLSATLSSVPTGPVPTLTATPVPPVSDEAQTLIDELRTLNLYVALIANGGFQDVLCSAINPPALSNNTGLNGTAIQNEVCFSAGIQRINPPLSPSVIIANQFATQQVAEIALFAVQVVGGYGGVGGVGRVGGGVTKEERAKLCGEIDETLLNNVFNGYVPGEGSRVKRFVCGR